MEDTVLLNALVAKLGAEAGKAAYDKIMSIKSRTVK